MAADAYAGCVFCDKAFDIECDVIAAGGTRPRVVHFEPLNPVTPGHRLFIPTAHIWSAIDVPEMTADVWVAAAMWAKDQDLDCNLMSSVGPDATQTISHFHVHYVPRHPGDGLHLPWTGRTQREKH